MYCTMRMNIFLVVTVITLKFSDVNGLKKNLPPTAQKVHILGLFDASEEEEMSLFEAAINKTNFDPSLLKNTMLVSVVEVVDKYDAFNVTKAVCNRLKENENITAIIGPSSPDTIEVVKSIARKLSIPHIYSAYAPFESNVTDNYTSYNIYPDLRLLSEGISQLIYDMDWVSFTILYVDDEDLILFQELLKVHDKHQFEENYAPIVLRQLPSHGEYRTVLKEASKNMESRFVVICNKDRIISLLDQAHELELTGTYYNYVMVAFDAYMLHFDGTYGDTNITFFRMFNVEKYKDKQTHTLLQKYPSTELIKTSSALVYDSVLHFAKTLDKYRVYNELTMKPKSCEKVNDDDAEQAVNEPKENITNQKLEMFDEKDDYAKDNIEGAEETSATWQDGLELSKRIHETGVSGLSDVVKFNATGQRSVFTLELIQLMKPQRNQKSLKILGSWSPEKKIQYARNETELHTDLREFIANRTFLVASKLGEPYLMLADNYKQKPENEQYVGFAVDLIHEISRIVPFSYRIYKVEDNLHGKKDPITGKYNGIIRDLQERRADLGICDLTINEERKQVVDFTKPFMTLGISILYKEGKKEDAYLFSFLQPIDLKVWLCVGTALLSVSLVLFFVSRCTPLDWENPHPCDPNTNELENQLTLVSCLWFSLGSVLQQGCDILPKAWSTRLIAAMWWFFTLIMVSTYTANLAAFLTTKQMEAEIKNIDQLSSQSKIRYGCYENGATAAFFKGSNDSLYQKVWATMESTKPSVFTKDNKEGVNRVLNDKQGYAFFMESSSIEYELERHCELTQIGGLLDNKGYGIAMPLNSPYRTEISSAVLQLQENGRIRELKDYWWGIGSSNCQRNSKDDEDENAMEFSNVGGVFLVLITGIGISFMLAILEFLWNIRKVAVVEKVTLKQAFWAELKFVLQIHRGTKPIKIKQAEESEDPLEKYRQLVAFVNNNKSHLL